MPTPYHKLDPKHRYKLGEGAAAGMLLACRCTHCFGPTVIFAAADLVRVLSPERDFYEPPFACRKCGMRHYVDVKLRAPSDDDVGHLVVRRLAGVRETSVWRDEVLGDGDVEVFKEAVRRAMARKP